MVEKINKTPTVVGVCSGFVGNRILFSRQKQALNMVYNGLMPWDIDKAINEFGFKMGPFQMSDLAGLDIGWKKEKRRQILSEMHYVNWTEEVRKPMLGIMIMMRTEFQGCPK